MKKSRKKRVFLIFHVVPNKRHDAAIWCVCSKYANALGIPPPPPILEKTVPFDLPSCVNFWEVVHVD